MQDEAEARATAVTAYATEFLESYTKAVDTRFPAELEVISDLGMDASYFPLYGRVFGVDTAVSVLFSLHDFYLFFLAVDGSAVVEIKDAEDDPNFTKEWTFDTPAIMRITQVRDLLELSVDTILCPSPEFHCLSIPSPGFIRHSVGRILTAARQHANNWANQAGMRASEDLPALQKEFQRKLRQVELSKRYLVLKDSALAPQLRGQAFEVLWREVLDFYGWRPRKIRISGEENDFTALYQGLHILGEVRWFAKPMNGGKMREFLGKLDPRPQTIGMFVSHSGLDDGARSVIRRAVNSKTVVVFELADIEAVFQGADIGEIFDEKLRNAYDYIFEHGQEL